jgi:DNA-binding PucR family transcriptional regulator
MPFSHLEILPTAHHQAVFAIGEADGKNGIFYCRKFAFNYLLRILSGAELTQDLLHPAVDTLSRYDRENGSELLKTLFIYLQQSMNQIHAADALFIHRNTLKYRLARIEELTHIDLDDPEEKLYLSLSLRLAGEK